MTGLLIDEGGPWKCFHCDDTFTTRIDARTHFGGDQGELAACQIKQPGEFSLLLALRNAQDELARYRSEDSDVLRAMSAMQADHAAALRTQEEKGYGKGLADGRDPLKLEDGVYVGGVRIGPVVPAMMLDWSSVDERPAKTDRRLIIATDGTARWMATAYAEIHWPPTWCGRSATHWVFAPEFSPSPAEAI